MNPKVFRGVPVSQLTPGHTRRPSSSTVLVASFWNSRFLLRLPEGNLFLISKAGAMCRLGAL